MLRPGTHRVIRTAWLRSWRGSSFRPWAGVEKEKEAEPEQLGDCVATLQIWVTDAKRASGVSKLLGLQLNRMSWAQYIMHRLAVRLLVGGRSTRHGLSAPWPE